jgi:hypothetical protein
VQLKVPSAQFVFSLHLRTEQSRVLQVLHTGTSLTSGVTLLFASPRSLQYSVALSVFSVDGAILRRAAIHYLLYDRTILRYLLLFLSYACPGWGGGKIRREGWMSPVT